MSALTTSASSATTCAGDFQSAFAGSSEAAFRPPAREPSAASPQAGISISYSSTLSDAFGFGASMRSLTVRSARPKRKNFENSAVSVSAAGSTHSPPLRMLTFAFSMLAP